MNAPQDIQEPEPSQSKDTLVSAIHPIKALTLPMMDAGCRQMRSPPDGQKQREQQVIQVGPVHNPTSFDVPAATFAILKRRFHTHTPGIDLHLSASGTLIADEQPRFLTAYVPHQADVGVQRLLLPDPGCAIPAIAWRCRTIWSKRFHDCSSLPLKERRQVCSPQTRNR